MTKTLLLSLVFLFSLTTLNAQENFENSTLALMENIATNSKQKNVIDFLKKTNYEKVSESDDDGVTSYYFMGPDSEMMRIVYNKSKKLKQITTIISSVYPILIDMQTNLSKHKFENVNYSFLMWRKPSSPYQFLTQKDDEDSYKNIVHLVTKNSELYK